MGGILGRWRWNAIERSSEITCGKRQHALEAKEESSAWSSCVKYWTEKEQPKQNLAKKWA